MNRAVVILMVFSLTLIASYVLAVPVPDEKLEKAIDPTKPDSWTPRVREVQEELRQIAKALISVAQNRERSDEDRRAAIQALGEIGNSESLDFLVDNIFLRIPLKKVKGDEDKLLETPCLHALLQSVDWNAIPRVLRALSQPVDEDAVSTYAHLLIAIMGTHRAKALLKGVIETESGTNAPNRVRIESLSAVLERVKKTR
jgi:HEAT repeat protein